MSHYCTRQEDLNGNLFQNQTKDPLVIASSSSSTSFSPSLVNASSSSPQPPLLIASSSPSSLSSSSPPLVNASSSSSTTSTSTSSTTTTSSSPLVISSSSSSPPPQPSQPPLAFQACKHATTASKFFKHSSSTDVFSQSFGPKDLTKFHSFFSFANTHPHSLNIDSSNTINIDNINLINFDFNNLNSNANSNSNSVNTISSNTYTDSLYTDYSFTTNADTITETETETETNSNSDSNGSLNNFFHNKNTITDFTQNNQTQTNQTQTLSNSLNQISFSDFKQTQTNQSQTETETQTNQLLPPISQENIGKRTIVFDLDETLIHSSLSFQPKAVPVLTDVEVHIVQSSPSSFSQSCPFAVQYVPNAHKLRSVVYVLIRPFAKYVIEELSKFYEIVIFTASEQQYATEVLNIIDPNNITLRLFRNSCTLYSNAFVKDLSKLGRSLENVIIVDNSEKSFLLHPNNGIHISTWTEKPDDKELLDLLELLTNDEFFSCSDVRHLIEKMKTNGTL